MSTKRTTKSTLHKALINAVVETDDLPMVEVVALILAIKETSISKIAKELGVSRQMLYSVLAGSRKSKRIKEALSGTLGFEP